MQEMSYSEARKQKIILQFLEQKEGYDHYETIPERKKIKIPLRTKVKKNCPYCKAVEIMWKKLNDNFKDDPMGREGRRTKLEAPMRGINYGEPGYMDLIKNHCASCKKKRKDGKKILVNVETNWLDPETGFHTHECPECKTEFPLNLDEGYAGPVWNQELYEGPYGDKQ